MPIQFSCPFCGTQTNVDDQYAGKCGPCSACGKTVTIPGRPPDPFASRMSGYVGDGRNAPRRSGFPVWAILLIVAVATAPFLLAIGGILVALLVPAFQAANEESHRLDCKNNLRHITLAILNYQDQTGELPPRYIPDENGRPMHSWRVLILPYLDDPEAQSVYDEYDFSEPWDGPNNRRLHDRMPSVFGCPSDSSRSESRGGDTNYVVIAGPDAPLQPAVPRQPPGDPSSDNPLARWRSTTTIASLLDGPSKTIAVVEVVGLHVNWLEPVDLDVGDAVAPINESRDGPCIASRHPHGVNAAFFDGRVDFLSEHTPVEQLEQMLDRWSGQKVESGDGPP